MDKRPLGKTGFDVSPIGYGAFKIGRNEGIKYPEKYELPNEKCVTNLLNEILDLGINYIDTAPAYGLSEERIGQAIAHRKSEFVVSTKVGERFENGKAIYDFSEDGVKRSIVLSRKRLKLGTLDIVFVHSDGNDLHIQNETDVVPTLETLRNIGEIRAIGFSGKTVEGARQALSWADVIMVEYHTNDDSHADVIREAAEQNVGVVVKKGLASGNLSADHAVRFALKDNSVSSMVIGSLKMEHIRKNVRIAESL